MTIFTTLIWGYRLILLALLVIVTRKGTVPMLRTALTMAAIYVIQFVAAEPWGLALWPGLQWSGLVAALDIAGLLIVTLRPHGNWQIVIGGTFLLQFGCHAARIASELNTGYADLDLYWWGLTLLAYMQLGLFGGWLGDFFWRSRHPGIDGDNLQAVPASRGTMG